MKGPVWDTAWQPLIPQGPALDTVSCSWVFIAPAAGGGGGGEGLP